MITYKDAVNEVLMRMREDTVATIGSSRLAVTDDPVVDIVKLAVSDSLRFCENAHNWNALRHDWTVNTVAGTHTYALTGANNCATIESVYGDNGAVIKNTPLSEIHRRSASQASVVGIPSVWALNGQDNNGDMRIRLFNTPDSSGVVTVHGFLKSSSLNLDGDKIRIPELPVIYLALAKASAERGETGGSQATELFQLADRYLKDAIGRDAANTDLDNDWIVH